MSSGSTRFVVSARPDASGAGTGDAVTSGTGAGDGVKRKGGAAGAGGAGGGGAPWKHCAA